MGGARLVPWIRYAYASNAAVSWRVSRRRTSPATYYRDLASRGLARSSARRGNASPRRSPRTKPCERGASGTARPTTEAVLEPERSTTPASRKPCSTRWRTPGDGRHTWSTSPTSSSPRAPRRSGSPPRSSPRCSLDDITQRWAEQPSAGTKLGSRRDAFRLRGFEYKEDISQTAERQVGRCFEPNAQRRARPSIGSSVARSSPSLPATANHARSMHRR
jgi:hypothetical protein